MKYDFGYTRNSDSETIYTSSVAISKGWPLRRQRGSVVRVGDLNGEHPGLNSSLRLLSGICPRFVNSQLVWIL